MSLRAAAVVACLAGVGGGLAPAARAQPQRLAEQTAALWQQVTRPQLRRARSLTSHAVRLREHEARRAASAHERAEIVRGAIHRLEIAHELVPDDAEILYELAHTMSLFERPRGPGARPERMEARALELFAALGRLDPHWRPEDVAFETGILHTRRHEFAAAVEDYERAIRHAMMPSSGTSIVSHGNLAEVTMMAGDVEASVALYRRTIELATRQGAPTVTMMWGLAVALDRLGEHAAAIEQARRALAAGGGDTSPLHEDFVFFEPAFEIHWYEGLAALAGAEEDADAELEQLSRARDEFRTYLREGGDEGAWPDLAERHVRQAEARIEALRARSARPARRPR